ncbi:MAG: U32 family peptidase [Clostridia bacterium]|nr:U32 family peptidase [Clostridia bacterium]
MKKNEPEILSPAGNLEKLRFAVDYGADAVYCALREFGMRAASDNFTPEELAQGIRYAHSHGAKVYLTLNTMPSELKIAELPEVLDGITGSVPDAFIISDPGVMRIVKKRFPDTAIHLSTQASTVNAEGCRFWYENGVKRIVLARELTIDAIRAIRENTPPELELEAFVHGAMCISYSGRCLLSNHFTGRNANEGRCAQPCRWKYYLREEKRPDELITAEQFSEGTYVFSSKDLCMLEHMDDLCFCGLDSLKIEGRMKSAYYAACVTNAYKCALKDHIAGKPFNKALLAEVEGVSHREYHTGFYYDEPAENAVAVTGPGYICDKPFYGYVLSYDETTSLARCFQKNKMFAHSKAELLTPGGTGRVIDIDAIYNEDMEPIDSTPRPKQEFFIKIPGARPGDILRAYDN